MVSDAKWQDRARGLLRAQLSLRNMGYKELVEKLAETGIKETPQSIANKISGPVSMPPGSCGACTPSDVIIST